jgi:hypothetical protein
MLDLRVVFFIKVGNLVEDLLAHVPSRAPCCLLLADLAGRATARSAMVDAAHCVGYYSAQDVPRRLLPIWDTSAPATSSFGMGCCVLPPGRPAPRPCWRLSRRTQASKWSGIMRCLGGTSH